MQENSCTGLDYSQNEILADFIKSIKGENELIEISIAPTGTSKFSTAYYFENLDEEVLEEIFNSPQNVSFSCGLLKSLMPTTLRLEQLVQRIGSDSYVKYKRVVSFDLDFKDNFKDYNDNDVDSLVEKVKIQVLDSLKKSNLTPWLIVFSGNGIHLHYKLKTPFKIDSQQGHKFTYDGMRSVLEGITQFKFDPTCCNPSRLMRLPLSTNWKIESKPKKTKVLFYDPENDFSEKFYKFDLAFRPNNDLHQDSGYIDKKSIIQNLDLMKVLEYFKYSKMSTLKENNGRIICSGPFSKDSDPSFYYDKNKKVFFDFSTSKGGDLLSLIGYFSNLSTKSDFISILKLGQKILKINDDTEKNVESDPNPSFYVDEVGVWYKGSDKLPPKWLSTPVEILALTRDINSKSWGRLLSFKDQDNIQKTWALPMELLATDGSEIRKNLLSLGVQLAVSLKERQLFLVYLQLQRPSRRITCVHRIGWHQNQFVLPEKVFTPEGISNDVILQSKYCEPGLSCAGSLNDWKENVGKYCNKNSKLILVVSMAFATALLKITNEESGGFHLVGPSSIGKSIALKVATSVWGSSGLDGLIRKWRSTLNGLEMLASSRCDSLLVLDELGEIKANDAGPAAYLLSGGISKNRATKNASIEKQNQWRLLFLSSGEISLNNHMANSQEHTFVGQEIRMIDIDAESHPEYGIFENIFDFSCSGTFANMLSSNTEKYYGTPIVTFLEQILKDTNLLSKLIRLRGEFCKEYPALVHGQTHRVLKRFSLIAAAGELAISYGILPLPKGSVNEHIHKIFDKWTQTWGSFTNNQRPKEFQKLIDQIKSLLQEFGPSRFPLLDEFKSIGINHSQKLWGFRIQNGEDQEWIILSEVFRNILCKNYDYKRAVQDLKENGFLLKVSVPTRVPHLGVTRTYTLSNRIIL